jgi:uncharacterized membrane protein
MVYASFFQFLPLMVVSIVGVQQYGAMAPLDGLGNVAHIETVLCFLGVGFIFGVVLTTPIFVMLKQVKTQTMKELLRYAFIVSSASVIAILLVEIGIKPVFQRERFRFIYACGLLDSESLDKYNQAFGGFHP